jgi:hypothetical protein
VRRVAALLIAGAVSAVVLVPATPASADCNVVLYLLTGRCANACTVVRDVYAALDTATGGLLPDLIGPCPA